jgi:hypothetical protein
VSQKKVSRLRQRRHASAADEQNGQRRADAPPPKAYTTQHRPFRPLQAQKISLTLMRTNRAVQSGPHRGAARTTPGALSRPGAAAAEPSHMLLNTVNERDGALRRSAAGARPKKYKHLDALSCRKRRRERICRSVGFARHRNRHAAREQRPRPLLAITTRRSARSLEAPRATSSP